MNRREWYAAWHSQRLACRDSGRGASEGAVCRDGILIRAGWGAWRDNGEGTSLARLLEVVAEYRQELATCRKLWGPDAAGSSWASAWHYMLAARRYRQGLRPIHWNHFGRGHGYAAQVQAYRDVLSGKA